MAPVADGEPNLSPITLHSSWRGLLSSLIGALLITAAGTTGVLLAGVRVLPTIFLVAGVGFLMVVMFDYPVASTFSEEGIRRRMPLRAQRFSWDEIAQFTRVRPGITRGLRGLEHGGLAVLVGRRRYLLLDQPESPDEFDQLYRLAGERVADLGLTGRIRPSDRTNPTWLYRRAKWAPEDANRR